MLPPKVEYLKNQLSKHISLFFTPRASELFNSGMIRFLPRDEAFRTSDRVIAIPYDVPLPEVPQEPYRVKFNNTELTLYNRTDRPQRGTWTAIPNESTPLWYQNQQGTLIPAWNLFGNLFHLLTFGEERDSSQRDSHGRLAGAFSPRTSVGILEVPAINDAAAAIIAGAAGLVKNEIKSDLDHLVKPPVVIFSHDCDILLGNDFWTQAVRAFRVVSPLIKFRPPKIGNLWWIVRNAATPRKFYFDNATGMVDLERCFGYNSTFYLLNGKGGRFGARSRPGSVRQLAQEIPPGWEIGLHYNYDTFLDDDRFHSQLVQLHELTGRNIVSGRAHYLRFDPQQSFAFLRKHGIRVDESSGYADRIGYRNGIAGCFQAYDTDSDKPLDIWEVPMTVMDAVLVRQYGDRAVEKFSQLVYHLSCVGGALSIVFHPGQFFNPEHKQMLEIYHRLLMECRQVGAVSQTAQSLLKRMDR